MPIHLTAFLQAVLPAKGNVYFQGSPKTVNDRTFISHRFSSTPRDLGVELRAAIVGNPEKDYYHAMASYVAPPYRDATTNKYVTNRVATNVSHLRSLWADLDCLRPGEAPDEKKYTSKTEALRAVVELVQAGKMPAPSYIVDSGGGVHVYWVGDEDIDRPTWQPIAEGLKHHLVAEGLKLDPTVSADAARILRTPSSFNNKNPKAPRPVKIIHEVGTVYPWAQLTYAVPAGIANRAAARQQKVTAQDLAAPKPIVRGCRQVREQWDTHGAGTSGFQWMLLASLLVRVVGGQALFHRMSDGHEGYNASSTDHKFAQAVSKYQDKSIFTTCRNFEEVNPEGCKGCPFKGRIKTPLDLGWDLTNKPPMGYRQDVDGIHMHYTPEEGEPQWIRLSPRRFHGLEWYINDDGHRVLAALCLNNGSERQVRLNISTVQHSSTTTISNHFHSQGIEVCRGQDKNMGDLVRTWADLLEVARPSSATGDVLGWDVERKKFTFPHVVVHPKGVTANTIRPDKGRTASLYQPHGVYSDWKEAIDVVTAGGDMALQVLLATSFAAPLLTFTGNEGFTLVIRSDASGLGKTTVAKLAQAVWGTPQAMAHKDDTMNSVMNRLGDAGNMPFYWDEARLDTPQHRQGIYETIFNMPRGREKTRMNSDTTQREPRKWSTILSMTTNYRISDLAELDAVDPSAFLARMFELEAGQGANWSPKVSGVLHAGTESWGYAGVEYITHLQQNRAKLKPALDGVMAKLGAITAGNGGLPRYHVAFFSCILVGAAFARAAGIAPFHMQPLRDYVEAALRANVQGAALTRAAYTNSFDPVDLFAAWVMQERARWVVTQALPSQLGAQWYAPRLSPTFHIDAHRGEVIVRAVDVTAWIKQQAITSAELRRRLPGADTAMVRTFAAGTSYASTRSRCIVVSLKKLGIDEAVKEFLRQPPITGSTATHEVYT